jgi:hypothetical protein
MDRQDFLKLVSMLDMSRADFGWLAKVCDQPPPEDASLPPSVAQDAARARRIRAAYSPAAVMERSVRYPEGGRLR